MPIKYTKNIVVILLFLFIITVLVFDFNKMQVDIKTTLLVVVVLFAVVLLNFDKIKNFSALGLQIELKEQIKEAKVATVKAEKAIAAIKITILSYLESSMNNVFILKFDGMCGIAPEKSEEKDKEIQDSIIKIINSFVTYFDDSDDIVFSVKLLFQNATNRLFSNFLPYQISALINKHKRGFDKTIIDLSPLLNDETSTKTILCRYAKDNNIQISDSQLGEIEHFANDYISLLKKYKSIVSNPQEWITTNLPHLNVKIKH